MNSAVVPLPKSESDAGCHRPRQGMRNESRGALLTLLVLPAVIARAAFAGLLTLHPAAI